MAKTNHNNINNKGDIKMAKYIVEAPEPKKGQKVSSGGIREKGRLASQFKNPVPYKEPMLPPASVVQKPHSELVRKEQARARRNEVGKYLFSIAWEEIGEPLLRSGIHRLGRTVISKIEAQTSQTVQHRSLLETEIIEVEPDEIQNIYDEDNIIRFPNKKVI